MPKRTTAVPRAVVWLLAALAAGLLFAGWPAARAEDAPGAEKAKAKAKSESHSKSFTVVLLPDTQLYSEDYPQHFVAQTWWIRKNVEQRNIKFVIHLGDIVEHPDEEIEWKNADRAMNLLDDAVPYSVLPGNHDISEGGGTELYNRTFGVWRYKDKPWYGGGLDRKNDNNYCLFEAAGMKFIVLSLEYVPRKPAVDWANRVLARHTDRRAIVATHVYLGPKGKRHSYGRQLWNGLVRKHKNVFLVVSGHFPAVARHKSRGDAGNTVHEILVDFQRLPNGGNGWLCWLRFVPVQNKIHVETYSPVLNKFKKDQKHAFTIDYKMTAKPAPATKAAGR